MPPFLLFDVIADKVHRTLDMTSLITMKGKVVQLRRIKNCRLAEKFIANDYRRCQDNG